MMKEFVIDSLDSRVINTQYGSKEQWLVNGKASAFKSSWNAGWKVGDKVKADVVEKMANGKKYVNLMCPPELKKQGGFGGVDFKMINAKLDRIIALLEGSDNESENTFEFNEPAETDSAEDDDVKLEDIPF